ncbi:hypothetical protein [Vulcanisaeta thermophila]|uniref:hypothetical protein n=1 Tax=Vulcanisaeta thermophila TaxID=867917 RepID=UPI0008538F35|nr:hypothetical protein [Vulcanisaeta thermophila]
MVLTVRIANADEEATRTVINEILESANALGIPTSDLVIYVADSHDKVREVLGMETLGLEEWPIKYLGEEGGYVVSVIPSELMRLDYYRRRLLIMRELAVIIALNDPVYLSYWSYEEERYNDPLIHRVSLALLRRAVELIIVKAGLHEYVARGFEREELRNTLSTCKPTRDCAVAALALDSPLSIELGGNAGLGKALWGGVTKNLVSDFVRRYDDFRDFVRNNFNVESTYNYLTMLFRE